MVSSATPRSCRFVANPRRMRAIRATLAVRNHVGTYGQLPSAQPARAQLLSSRRSRSDLRQGGSVPHLSSLWEGTADDFAELAKLKASDVLKPGAAAEEVQASELRHHRAARKRPQTPPSRGRYLKSLPRLKEALPNYSADRERAIQATL
jgi:hypothetical protein